MPRKRKNKNSIIVRLRKILADAFQSKELLGLTWVMIIILLVTLVIIKDNKVSSGPNISCEHCAPVITQPVAISTYDLIESASAAKITRWQSFGDNFSSLVYLNEAKSDMFFDDKITSLIFPPLYSWTERFDCENISCFSSRDFLIPVEIHNSNYSQAEETKKIIASLPRPLPSEIEGREVLSVNINRLNLRQVVSFVVQEEEEERGLVYFLDEKDYTPIITYDSEISMVTSFGSTGGRVVAGGEDNDFLILYSGYESQAWHYKDGLLKDVSRFFGLRVASGGFYPFIVKQGRGNDTTWYILSLSSNKFKLIKLWKNGTNQIQGGVDLSAQIAVKIRLSDGELVALRSGAEKGVVDFILQDSSGAFSLWSFHDLGFDNSRLRVALSDNINSRNLPVFRAFIRSIGLAAKGTNDGYEINFPNRNFKIYLGDNPENLLLVNPGQTIKFSGSERRLFWKIEFLPGDNSAYSPWFDHLNDLQYLVALDDI